MNQPLLEVSHDRGNGASRSAVQLRLPVINGLSITSLHPKFERSIRRLYSACAKGNLQKPDLNGMSVPTSERRVSHLYFTKI
jgi:hypothetical protein